jgi:hypothetical protein
MTEQELEVTPETVIDIYCEGHGPLGKVPFKEVDELVAKHREELGCYFSIKIDIV